MSQQEALCRNKDHAGLKLEDKNLSRYVTTLSRHREMKMAEKLCHDRKQLFRNTKLRVSNRTQDNFVATKKFYVVANTT